MLQTRWADIAAQASGQRALSAARAMYGASGSRASLATRALATSQRVYHARSRVPPVLHASAGVPKHSAPSKDYGYPKKHLVTLNTDGPILRSAFPKKTLIFLVVLSAAAYFLFEIREEDWADHVRASFSDDPSAKPFQFFKDREDLDQWFQQHEPDIGAPLKSPVVLQFLSENFPQMAAGWEIQEEEARVEIPITHGIRFQSNDPCEDYYAIGTAPGPGSKPWNYWSIYDGHAGKHTALYLQWHLHPNLSRALSGLSSESTSSVIHATIKDVFLKTDNDIMSQAKNAANWVPAANAAAITSMAPALSGSCALLATFDPEQSTLRVACVGDSRAVLGRWDPLEGKYVAKPLSTDQTGFNEAEVARIKAAHPEEDDILDPKSGRLMGLAVARAFGDHRWKWNNDFVKQIQSKFWGTAPRPQSKTPPYLTAEPEITETKIVRADPKDKSSKSDFMVMASDGLWDHISSEHAIECVERWLEAKERGNGLVTQDPKLQPPNFSNGVGSEQGIEYDTETGAQVSWKADPQYFAIEDDNAAVCLARNAMGGTRRGLFLGLLSLAGPLRRDAIDDTTVMVVFFDRQEDKKQFNREKKNSSWWPWTRLLDAEISGDARKS